MDKLIKLIEATKGLTVGHLILMAIGGFMTIMLMVLYENRTDVVRSALESKLSAIFVSGVLTIMIVIWIVSALIKHIDEQNTHLQEVMLDQINQLKEDLERANEMCDHHAEEIQRLRHSEANCLRRVHELKSIMLSHNIPVPPSGFGDLHG